MLLNNHRASRSWSSLFKPSQSISSPKVAGLWLPNPASLWTVPGAVLDMGLCCGSRAGGCAGRGADGDTGPRTGAGGELGRGSCGWCCKAALPERCMALFSAEALNSLGAPDLWAVLGSYSPTQRFPVGPGSVKRTESRWPSHPCFTLCTVWTVDLSLTPCTASLSCLSKRERQELHDGHTVLKRTNHWPVVTECHRHHYHYPLPLVDTESAIPAKTCWIFPALHPPAGSGPEEHSPACAHWWGLPATRMEMGSFLTIRLKIVLMWISTGHQGGMAGNEK